MLRITVAAVAALAGIGLAAPANADICANHDAQHYVTACAKGAGGAGPTFFWKDDEGKPHFDRAGDIPKKHYPAAAPS